MPSPLPRQVRWSLFARLSSSTAAFPVKKPGRLLQLFFRGLLSVHSRYDLHAHRVALCDPLHRRLRQLVCLCCRFDCYRVERTSSRAGVTPAEVQRLFTAHFIANNPHVMLAIRFNYPLRNAVNFFRAVCFCSSFISTARFSRLRMRFAFPIQIPSALSNCWFLRRASISKADPEPTRYRKWRARSMGSLDCITHFNSSAFLAPHSMSARLMTPTNFSPSSEPNVLMAEVAAWS